MWKLDDLKAMSDPTSTLYAIAIAAGLPNRAVRAFRSDLRLFKPEYAGVSAMLAMRRQQWEERQREEDREEDREGDREEDD